MVESMATRPTLSITASRIGPRSLRRPTSARATRGVEEVVTWRQPTPTDRHSRPEVSTSAKPRSRLLLGSSVGATGGRHALQVSHRGRGPGVRRHRHQHGVVRDRCERRHHVRAARVRRSPLRPGRGHGRVDARIQGLPHPRPEPAARPARQHLRPSGAELRVGRLHLSARQPLPLRLPPAHGVAGAPRALGHAAHAVDPDGAVVRRAARRLLQPRRREQPVLHRAVRQHPDRRPRPRAAEAGARLAEPRPRRRAAALRRPDRTGRDPPRLLLRVHLPSCGGRTEGRHRPRCRRQADRRRQAERLCDDGGVPSPARRTWRPCPPPASPTRTTGCARPGRRRSPTTSSWCACPPGRCPRRCGPARPTSPRAASPGRPTSATGSATKRRRSPSWATGTCSTPIPAADPTTPAPTCSPRTRRSETPSSSCHPCRPTCTPCPSASRRSSARGARRPCSTPTRCCSTPPPARAASPSRSASARASRSS